MEEDEEVQKTSQKTRKTALLYLVGSSRKERRGNSQEVHYLRVGNVNPGSRGGRNM